MNKSHRGWGTKSQNSSVVQPIPIGSAEVVEVNFDFEATADPADEVVPVYFTVGKDGQLHSMMPYGVKFSRGQQFMTGRKDGKSMSDGYERLIDRLDQDLRDHKQEIRDRDERLQADAQERELRYHDDAKEREDRILQAIERIEHSSERSVKRIEDQMEKLEHKFESVEQKIGEGHRHIQNISMSVIIGVAAMVVAVIVGIIWPTVFHTSSAVPTSPPTNSTK